MNHTTSDLESYHARNPINVDEENTCLRGICYSIPPSISYLVTDCLSCPLVGLKFIRIFGLATLDIQLREGSKDLNSQ